MKNIRFALLAVLLSAFGFLNAQVGINNDNSVPDASAMLDVKSDSKGILVPRMSSSQRMMISNAAAGLLVFDITTESFWFKDGMAWVELVSGNVNTLMDGDGDTKVQVEESTDEDVIRLDVDETEAIRVEFAFSNASSLHIQTHNSPIAAFSNGLPDWQSFKATARVKIDSLRMRMDPTALSGISSYNFNIYQGEGTSGTLLSSTSAAVPTNGSQTSQLVRIPITDEIILEKDSTYTISFDNRNGLRFKSMNPYANGRAGFDSDSDYILEVYTFATASNTTINGNLNLTGIDATVNANAFIGDGSALTNLPSQVSIGTIIMWPSETLPPGWIPCNGQPFVRSTYPELFDILGDTGDGTANVPNFRGRFPLGIGNSQTEFSTYHVIKSTGGKEKHKLVENEMPSHSHQVTVTFDEGQENGSSNRYSDLRGGDDQSKSYTSSSAGMDLPHNNMPPYYTINFIIKAE